VQGIIGTVRAYRAFAALRVPGGADSPPMPDKEVVEVSPDLHWEKAHEIVLDPGGVRVGREPNAA